MTKNHPTQRIKVPLYRSSYVANMLKACTLTSNTDDSTVLQKSRTEQEGLYIPFATRLGIEPVGFYTFNRGIWRTLCSYGGSEPDWSILYHQICTEKTVRTADDERPEMSAAILEKVLQKLVRWQENELELFYQQQRLWRRNLDHDDEDEEDQDDDQMYTQYYTDYNYAVSTFNTFYRITNCTYSNPLPKR